MKQYTIFLRRAGFKIPRVPTKFPPVLLFWKDFVEVAVVLLYDETEDKGETATEKGMSAAMEKSLVLSVSAGAGCYRHIQISEDETLFRLHETILSTFDFFDDHMHAFFMNNRAWNSHEAYVCPGGDVDWARGFSDEAELSRFHLIPGDKFLYIFDFGDNWRFQIKVLRVVDEVIQTPVVRKSKGQITQYDFDGNEDADF
jgi:hypothetical protein